MTATDQPLWICGEFFASAPKIGFSDTGNFWLKCCDLTGGETVMGISISSREMRKGATQARVTLDAPHRMTFFDDFGTAHEIAGETGLIARLAAEAQREGLLGPERAIHRFGDYRTEAKYVPGPGKEFYRIISSKTNGPWAVSKALAWKGYKRKRKGKPMPHEQLMRRELVQT